MSVDIRLDRETHDLPASFELVKGIERARQEVEILLLTFLGEWFLDITHGIPYFEHVLIKSPRRAQIEAILRAKIKEVPGIVRVPVIDIKIDNKTRRSRITINGIETEYGKMDVAV